MTYNDLFKNDESKQATYEKLINAYRKYIGEYFGWYDTLEDIKEDIKHDNLTDHETDDGRAFFHYLDDIFEFVVRPGEILDGDDMKEYAKYIY